MHKYSSRSYTPKTTVQRMLSTEMVVDPSKSVSVDVVVGVAEKAQNEVHMRLCWTVLTVPSVLHHWLANQQYNYFKSHACWLTALVTEHIRMDLICWSILPCISNTLSARRHSTPCLDVSRTVLMTLYQEATIQDAFRSALCYDGSLWLDKPCQLEVITLHNNIKRAFRISCQPISSQSSFLAEIFQHALAT